MDDIQQTPSHLSQALLFCLICNTPIKGARGYSWLDGLLRNPWSGVQTPQVLGYSGLRAADPLVRGSIPYGAGVSLRSWGFELHMSNQGTIERRYREAHTRSRSASRTSIKNHPTLTGQDTRECASLAHSVSHQ